MSVVTPSELIAAAETAEKLSAISGFPHNPDKASWSAAALRHEAQVIETESPW